MGITQKDIAREAGVTVSTVSRALGKKASISPDIRDKIASIAEKHGYRRKRSSNVVSYIIDKRFFLLTSHFYNRVIEGIEEELRRESFLFQFNSLEPDRFSAKGLELDNLAGIIVTSAYHDDFIQELRSMGVPLVLLDYYLPTADIDSILIDNADGVMVGLQHLSALGHRRIAYLAGDTREIGAADRLYGYRRAVAAFGLAAEEELVLPCEFSIQGACEVMRGYLERARVRPTAVMGVNDIVAIGALEASKAAGLRIPEDISVLGFDDIDLANDVVPRLSTMHVRKKLMGRLAVERLTRSIRNEESGFTKVALKPFLVERGSTGRPSGS